MRRFLTALIFVTCLAAQAQAPKLHLIKKPYLAAMAGGITCWPMRPTGRLYLSHSDRVEVLDSKTHTRIGTIAPTPGVHGIAVVPGSKVGFITVGKTNSVVMFNTETLQ